MRSVIVMLGAFAMLLALAFGSCGEGEAQTRAPLLLDTDRATFRGVGLGDSRAEVRRRLGLARCVKRGALAGFHRPGRADDPRSHCVLGYRGVAVWIAPPDGAYAFVVTDPRAQTSRGAGIGFDRSIVDELYPGAECATADSGVADETEAFCRAPVGDEGLLSDRDLHLGIDHDLLGPDRIGSLWLVATSPDGFSDR